MKRSMIFLGCLALLTAGCNKIQTVEEPAAEVPGRLTVDINVNRAGETRSFKKSWDVGDVIYVAFDHFFTTETEAQTSNNPLYLTLTYDGFTWQSEFSDEALVDYLMGQTSGSLAAVFYSNLAEAPKWWVMHVKRGSQEAYLLDMKNNLNVFGFYLYDEACRYSVSNGKLTATLNMHTYERAVNFFIPGVALPSNLFRYNLECEWIRPVRCSGIMSQNINDAGFEDPVVSSSSDASPLLGTYLPDGVSFSGRLSNANYLSQDMEYVIRVIDRRAPSTERDDISYTLTKTASLYGRDAIELPPLDSPRWERAFVSPGTDKGFIDNHEFVRMADGRRWSALNVGAVDENDPGDFLIWPDARDAAKAWGENWSLPTQEMWDALLSNDNHEVTPVYETVDGQQVFTGLQVKALTDCQQNGFYYVTSGNKLFLPAAGYKKKPTSYFVSYGLQKGYYWTFTYFWQGTDPRVNYVSMTPETPYYSPDNMTIDAMTYMLARPVYTK